MKKYVKLIAIIICISLILVDLTACTTNASYFTFEPNTDETGYIITGVAKILPDKVVLPNKYQGKPVTKATVESKSVKELTIPNNIEKIRLNCNSLKTLNLAKDSEHFTIKDEVLYTYDLTRIVFVLPTKKDHFIIPRTIIAAEQWAFSCANIKVIYVPVEYLECYLIGVRSNEFDILLWNDKDYESEFSPFVLYNQEIIINFEANINEQYKAFADKLYNDKTVHWNVAMPL